jgi:hypothetical protein
MSGAVEDDDQAQPDDAGFDALRKQICRQQIAGLLSLVESGRAILRAIDTLRVRELASAREKGESPTSEAALKSEAAYQKARRRVIRSIDASLAQAFGLMEQGDQPLH